MTYCNRQDAISIIFSIGRNPRASRVICTNNIPPVFPGFLLLRHKFRPVVNMQNHRFILITDAPAKNRSMVTVSENKTFQVLFRCLPKELGIQFRPPITRPVSSFIQYADTHFISYIHIETRINLCMRTDCIGIHSLNSSEPCPRISARHLRNTHKVPGITS